MLPVQTDYLLNKRIQLTQPQNGYRAGLDAVLLAAAAPAENHETVLDVGCGVGAASLCLQARLPHLQITGIDIQHEMIALAKNNAAQNSFAQMRFLTGDIMNKQPELASASFDHVITNPPYLEVGNLTLPPEANRATAFATEIPLADWIGFCRKKLKNSGWLTVIYRADRLPELLDALAGFGAITIIPIWPKPGAAAKRVIVRAQKARKTPATLHPGLLLYDAAGQDTAAATAILRGGSALI